MGIGTGERKAMNAEVNDERTLSIYVISAGPSVKIGISGLPEQRLKTLQSANPNQILSLEWTATGNATIIRKAERGAHARLAEHCIGNEWFWTQPSVAINAVIDAVNEGDGFR